MDTELLEIRDFIAAQLPFDLLPEKAKDTLASNIEIQYLKRGTRLTDIDESLLVVRTGAVDLRDKEGAIYDRLGEGDLLALAFGKKGAFDNSSCIVSEDCLAYRLPRDLIQQLRAAHRSFDRHFELSLHQRVQRIR